jgi:tripartite-type tricarboxylate transporter receptor subunit TctC
MSPYLEDYLDANVLIDNRPGAGGLLAANSLYTGDDSGLEFGFFAGQGIGGAVLGEAEGVGFELGEFSYIARAAADARVLSVGAGSGYDTIEDVLAADDFVFGSSGPGGADHIDANVLFQALDLQGRIVTGYDGSAETELAATAGQVDGVSGTYAARSGAIEDGDHVPVLILNDEPIEEQPDVPIVLDLDLDDEQRELAEAHLSLQALGRMILAPPGVPEDRLQLLRDAFESVLTNPDFLEEMEAMGEPTDYLSGEELEQVVAEVLDAPEAYVQLLRESYAAQ